MANNKTVQGLIGNSSILYQSMEKFNVKKEGIIFNLRGDKVVKKVVDLDCLNNKNDSLYNDNDCVNESLTNVININVKNNKVIIINSTKNEPGELAMISEFFSADANFSKSKIGSSDVKIDLKKLGDDDVIPTARVNSNGDVYEIGKEIEYKELKEHRFDKNIHEEYISELFTVNAYNVSQIIQKARSSGYVVRVGSMYASPPFEIYNGTSKKILYDPEGKNMDMLFNEYINAVDEGFITISVSNSDYSFSAKPWKGRGTPFLWKIGIKIKNDNIPSDEISKDIKATLQNLDLVNDSFNLKYKQLEKEKQVGNKK